MSPGDTVRCACGRLVRPGDRFRAICGRSLAAPAPAPEPRTYTPRHLAEKSSSLSAPPTPSSGRPVTRRSTGEWEEAASAFEAGLASCREHGVRLDVEAEQLAWLAEAHLGRGDPRTALATADEARGIGHSRGQQLGELDAEIIRARALVRLGSPDAAEAALAAAAALVERTGAGSRTPFLHLARAELAAARGDPDARERELREAHRLFVEMGAPLRAELVARELGER